MTDILQMGEAGATAAKAEAAYKPLPAPNRPTSIPWDAPANGGVDAERARNLESAFTFGGASKAGVPDHMLSGGGGGVMNDLGSTFGDMRNVASQRVRYTATTLG